MARGFSGQLHSRLSRAQIIAGWLYLPFYLVLLSPILQYLCALAGITLDDITLNLLYFGVNLAAVLIIFRNFLRQRFFGPGFWNFVQACILGFVFYHAGTWLVQFAISELGAELVVYNNDTIVGLVAQNRYVMLLISIILAPFIEETLLRGLVFGSLCRTSRILAYAASIVLFSLMHNWVYFGAQPFVSVLRSCLSYVPAAAALCWTYEKSDTIWAPITVHAIINAISFGILVLP